MEAKAGDSSGSGLANSGPIKNNSPLGFVQLNKFLQAIEMTMNDVKTDPYNLVHKLLLTFYSGQEVVTVTDFHKFFGRFDSYFGEPEVVTAFLREVSELETPDGKI